jgi:hypothetical protein
MDGYRKVSECRPRSLSARLATIARDGKKKVCQPAGV